MTGEVYASDYPETSISHEDRARSWCDGLKIRDRLIELASVEHPDVAGFFEGERLDRAVSMLLQRGARPGDDDPLIGIIMLVTICEDMQNDGFVFRTEKA